MRDGITGTLFKADDIEDLVDSLLALLDQEERWPLIRQAGRDFVENERNWVNSVANLKPVYRRLVPGGFQ